MTPDKLDAIAALAEKATPGPWRSTELPAGVGAAAFGRYIVSAEESGYPGALLEGIRAGIEARYIAALDPATVTELIEAARALRDFMALLPPDRWALLRPDTLSAIAGFDGAPRSVHSLPEVRAHHRRGALEAHARRRAAALRETRP